MYAGVVHKPLDIRYEEIDTPSPASGEVLVKVKYTGICGSDVPRVNADACHYFPNVLGHEFSGTVAALGEGVTGRAVGDRVAGIPLIPCMKCPDCMRGDYSLCAHYSFIGSRRFGSFAEYVAVPAENTFVLDDSISFAQGALFEPSAVALHGIRCADYLPGKYAAVIGCGTIGLLTAQWCRILGARKVAVFNRGRERLALCGSLGADAAVCTAEGDYYETAQALTGGHGFDYVFDCVGSEATIHQAFRLAGNRAHVCIIGTPKEPVQFTVPQWELLNRKEMRLTGSWMSYSAPFPGDEWAETAAAFASGALKLEKSMLHGILPLSRIDEAFALFRTPGAVKGKILIDSEA